MDEPTPINEFPSKKGSVLRGAILTFLLVAMLAAAAIYLWRKSVSYESLPPVNKTGELPGDLLPPVDTSLLEGKVEAFESEEDFLDWLSEMSAGSNEGIGFGVGVLSARSFAMEEMAMPSAAVDMELGLGGEKAVTDQSVTRYSDTNVQVVGIDEPDIVKTDGEEIYFSPERYYYGRRSMVPVVFESEMVSDKAFAPEYKQPGVKAVKAWPPAELGLDSEIDIAGDLLLSNDTLIVITYDGLTAYDVSDPTAPVEKWEYEMDSRHSMLTTRLYGDKIYLVAQAGINWERPCPVVPLLRGEDRISIPCNAIYHPVLPVASDTTYSVLTIGVGSGSVEDSVSFVGSMSSSVVYMSTENLYVTHGLVGDLVDFLLGFMSENTDLFPESVISKVSRLQGYEISSGAKMLELQVIMEKWMLGLDQDDRLMMENEFSNRMDDYYKEHQRELQKTGIVRIGIDDLDVRASGTFPGNLLNQFSLDEYGGHLRVATTTGGQGGFGWQFGLGNRESVNDVYVLDENLGITGSVLDMGLGERIYSARFIQDKGYIVTFRETDPFYVLDLSDPDSPELKGELKIPGYSSYLHPISKDKILGTGKEGNNVKISLFDVTDPANPTEASKYSLDEYWSDVLNTHHAFLLDDKHHVFFLPGSKGGYIFSYEGDKLSLKKAVSGINARRAVFINDYLYIIGSDKIVVLNEADWERVNELKL